MHSQRRVTLSHKTYTTCLSWGRFIGSDAVGWIERCVTVNCKKTRMWHFRQKNVAQHSGVFLCGDTPLDYADSYRYLGLWFHVHCDMRYAVKELVKSASRALGFLTHKYYSCGDMHYNVFTKLYESIVQPVLTYCSGVWGICKYTEVYTVQNRACRIFMGVSKTTPNLAVRGDIGWLDPQMKLYIETARLWCRLERLPDNRLTHKIHNWSKSHGKSWEGKVQRIFRDLGVSNILNSNSMSSSWVLKHLTIELVSVDKANWYRGVHAMPKLRTYILLKSELRTETYVHLPRYKRSILASLRCGSLKLEIETGRFSKPPILPTDRLCKCCTNCVEDEQHFLIDCNLYDDIRSRELPNIFNNALSTNTANLIDLQTLLNNDTYISTVVRRPVTQHHVSTQKIIL